MKFMHILIIQLFIFLLSGCNEIPQGAIVDQSENFGEDRIIDETPITRPENQIFIQSNYCACKKGKPVNVSATCDNQCATQASTDIRTLLYLQVNIGAELENSQFQNLKGWCEQNLIDPETGENLESGLNQNCELIFTDKDSGLETRLQVDETLITGNSINALALTGIQENRRYSFTINETISNVTSDSKDLRVFDELTDTMLDVPLFIEPIYQYACITSTVTVDPNNNNASFENAQKVHFYYVIKPDPEISTNSININCHTEDPPNNQTPLIDQTPGQIKLWNRTDIRFADYIDPDTNQTFTDGTLFIDKIIEGLIEDLSGQDAPTNRYFSRFEYFTDPISASDSNAQQSLLGYLMVPFKDDNQNWFCPNLRNYAGSDLTFRALSEMINEETQGIYIAKQQDKDNDFIFIMEEDVKKAWFYLNENNIEIEPTNSTIRGKKIQFYWPISEDSPRQKKPHQVVYTIQAPTGVTNPANLPQDNRIGCAPKI